MAAQTALVIVNGTFERIPAADTLVVGAGITGPGDLAVTSADFGVGTGNGHEIDIAGGLGGTTGGHGGKVFLYGGAGQGTGAGGQVNIVGGAAGATGTAGNVLIDSGAPGSALGGVGIALSIPTEERLTEGAARRLCAVLESLALGAAGAALSRRSLLCTANLTSQ